MWKWVASKHDTPQIMFIQFYKSSMYSFLCPLTDGEPFCLAFTTGIPMKDIALYRAHCNVKNQNCSLRIIGAYISAYGRLTRFS